MNEIKKVNKIDLCNYLLNNNIESINFLLKDGNIYIFNNSELLNYYKLIRKELYKRGVFK